MRKLTRIAIAALLSAAFAVAGVASVTAAAGAGTGADHVIAEPPGPSGTPGDGTSWPWG